MNTLRYNYLRSVIGRLETQTQIADSIVARFLKNGDLTAVTVLDIESLATAVHSSADLAHEAAIQIPMFAEVSYD